MKISDIIYKVERYYQRPIDWNARNLEKVEPKRVFILICLKYQYHPVQIAEFVGCHRTTILYHQSQDSEYYQTRVNEVLNATTTELDITDVTEQIKYQLLKPIMANLTIDEIKQLIPTMELHIKAKQWKNNDDTKHYNCSTGISHLVH